jgi:hypothetical protein
MPDAPGIKFEREEGFTTLYANNTQFEASAWDLKIIFGQLDQSKGVDAVIQQHTAMTLSWTHAKLMAYFLLANVIAQQARTGFISVPPAVIPPRPDRSDPTLDNEEARRAVDYLAWVHDQFFGPNPFVPPPPEATTESRAESAG